MKTASRRARTSCSAVRLSAVVAGGMALALALAATMVVTVAAPAPAPAPASELSSWTPPVNLSSSGGSSPDMVVSADGTTAVAVWLRQKEGHRVVQSRTARIVDGAVRWSPKQDLTAVGSPFANSPKVAVSGDGGTAIVLWTSGNTSVRSRMAVIKNGTATWSAKQTVAPRGDDRVVYPEVAMSRDGGTAVTAWYRYRDDFSTQVVQSRTARISHGTASWKATHDLSHSSGVGYEYQPQVGVSRDGSTAVAVWTGVLANVQSSTARIDKGVATWAPAQDVSPVGSISRLAQVALSADGATAVAAWADQDFEQNVHVVRSRTAAISGATADWGGEADVLSGALGGYAPHVAVSRDGATAVAIWTGSSAGKFLAQSRAASIKAGSTTWSTLQNVSAPSEAAPSASDVALSADGTSAVAVWSFGSVRSRTASLAAGTATWERTRLVAAPGYRPLVGMSRDGRTAVAVWNRYDGTKKFRRILQSASAYRPGLRVRIPGTETVGVRSGVRIRASARVSRWRIEFSRAVRQPGVRRVTVIRGTGAPPFAVRVVWLNTRRVVLSTRVVTRSGQVLHNSTTVHPVSP